MQLDVVYHFFIVKPHSQTDEMGHQTRKTLTSFLLLFAFIIATRVVHVASHCGQGDVAAYCLQSVQQNNHQPRTCLDLLCRGETVSGVYNVHPTGSLYYSIPVYCDQTTAGGGWTVFQRRMDGTVDFYRNWANYKLGFGEAQAEHWLGNDNLHTLLSLHQFNELRIDMEAVSNERTYAHYGNFSVASEDDGYRLAIGDFKGTSIAGDALTRENGMMFTTKDRDHDTSGTDCAERFKGAWWYSDCHKSNLNGIYHYGSHDSFADGVNWQNWKGYNEALAKTEMKFRPKF